MLPVLRHLAVCVCVLRYQLTTPLEEYLIFPGSKGRPTMTSEDAEEGARRVREGFAWVGITEEWKLSICLFHRMFGGACHPSEFKDTRPSEPSKTAYADYNTSVLMGWHDDIDAVVYEAALDVFHQNVALHHVSHKSCSDCYQAAGLEAHEVSTQIG